MCDLRCAYWVIEVVVFRTIPISPTTHAQNEEVAESSTRTSKPQDLTSYQALVYKGTLVAIIFSPTLEVTAYAIMFARQSSFVEELSKAEGNVPAVNKIPFFDGIGLSGESSQISTLLSLKQSESLKNVVVYNEGNLGIDMTGWVVTQATP